jgi:hypothetical protein
MEKRGFGESGPAKFTVLCATCNAGNAQIVESDLSRWIPAGGLFTGIPFTPSSSFFE